MLRYLFLVTAAVVLLAACKKEDDLQSTSSPTGPTVTIPPPFVMQGNVTILGQPLYDHARAYIKGNSLDGFQGEPEMAEERGNCDLYFKQTVQGADYHPTLSAYRSPTDVDSVGLRQDNIHVLNIPGGELTLVIPGTSDGCDILAPLSCSYVTGYEAFAVIFLNQDGTEWIPVDILWMKPSDHAALVAEYGDDLFGLVTYSGMTPFSYWDAVNREALVDLACFIADLFGVSIGDAVSDPTGQTVLVSPNPPAAFFMPVFQIMLNDSTARVDGKNWIDMELAAPNQSPQPFPIFSVQPFQVELDSLGNEVRVDPPVLDPGFFQVPLRKIIPQVGTVDFSGTGVGWIPTSSAGLYFEQQ